MHDVNPRAGTQAADPPPQKPEAPLPSECCESGCDPCVYDTYAEELDWYRKALAAWRERHPEAGGQDP